ncbi:MAG: hypothetical protein HDS27_05750 [Bacteroides sp.]|nr:hypothetical protein [Bacteroides sp.]
MKYFFSIIAALFLLLSGCSGGERVLLERANAVMEEHPDSAMKILQEIDRGNLNGRDLPYFALLMTQAQVKTDVPLDSDSLLSIAFARYAGDPHGDKGIRASFYMGEVFFNQAKPPEAMRLYLSAYEDAKRLANDYWRAKAAERIADIFFNAYNYPEAIRYRGEAIEYYGKAGRLTNQRYATADLATDCLNGSMYDRALSLLDSVYAVAEKENPDDRRLLEYIRRMRIGTLATLGKIEDLSEDDLAALDNAPRNESFLDSEIQKLRIDEFRHNYRNEEALSDILSYAKTPEDKTLALYACYRHLKSTDRSSFESSVVDSLLFYQNEVAETIIRESALSAQRDFYSRLAVETQMESTRRLLVIWTVAIVAAIAAAATFIVIRLRDKVHRAELEATVESLMQAKAYSDIVNSEKYALRLEIDRRKAEAQGLSRIIKEHKETVEKLNNDTLNNRQQIENLEKEKTGLSEKLNDSNRRLMDLNEKLTRETTQQNEQIEALKKEYHLKEESRNAILDSLFMNRWTTLNRLCEEFFEKGASPKFQQLLMNDIEAEIKKISSKEGLRQIEEEVDRCMDGILTKLRMECPKLKEKDITVCSLTYAGFSVKAICFIIGMTSNTLYTRKNRLRQKIADLNPPHMNLFLAKL